MVMGNGALPTTMAAPDHPAATGQAVAADQPVSADQPVANGRAAAVNPGAATGQVTATERAVTSEQTMTTDQATTAQHAATAQQATTAQQAQQAAGYAAGYAGGQAPGHWAGPPIESALPPPVALPARPRSRRGAGGRWLVWCLRVVIWAILLLIGYRGVAAIVTEIQGSGHGAAGASGPATRPHAGAHGSGRAASGPASGRGDRGQPSTGKTSTGKTSTGKTSTGKTGSANAGTTGTGQANSGQVGVAANGFPVALAQAYALDFGAVYLNFSPASAGQRAAALAAFLPPGSSAQLGWNGTGTQTLQSDQALGTRVLSAHAAVVTLLAQVNGKLIELGVPIYAADGGIVVSGKPALLPPPARVAIPGAPHAAAVDPAAQASLSRQLPAFFRAFAGSAEVRSPSLVAGAAAIGGLNGVVTFGGISAVNAPASSGTTRHIAVTVLWRTAGQVKVRTSTAANVPAEIAMTYAMTVLQRNGSWYVVSIGASASMAGPTS